MTSKIEISHKTVIFILVLLASIWLVLEIRDILLLFFVSFILMASLHPFVESLEHRRIPRTISILFVYLLVFAIVGITVSGIIPVLVAQTSKLVANLPKMESIISPYYQIDIKALTQQIAPLSQDVLKVTFGVFSNIATTMMVLVFTFYLLLERKFLDSRLEELFGKENGGKIGETFEAVEFSLGSWMRGELLLMLIIGLLSYIALLLLHVDYALPLAIFAGLLEIIPTIGPIVSAIPAILVGLTVSPVLAVAVAAAYFVIQQLENQIVVPQIMKRTVGISPLITILAIMIGSRLAGITGAILAIPIVIALREILKKTVGSGEGRIS